MSTATRYLLFPLLCMLASPAARAQDAPQYADPAIAIRRTMKIEGGYVHAPRARGGQIYRGITRVSHPKWEGWKIVDKMKLRYEDTVAALDTLAAAFYKIHYWDEIRAGELTNQQTANQYFNQAVRIGIDRAVMRTQRAVGLPATGVVNDSLIARLNRRSNVQFSLAKKPHNSKKHHATTHKPHGKQAAHRKHK